MKKPTYFLTVAVLFFIFSFPFALRAQETLSDSLKERGYQEIGLTASYAFFNDLNEITIAGNFEGAVAGYRFLKDVYEILIDLGSKEEIIYIEKKEFLAIAHAKDGISYQESVYSDGSEEVFATINIGGKTAFYSGEREVVP